MSLQDKPFVGLYDHLNEDDRMEIAMTMEEVVTNILNMNYGVHRFLSELIRQRRALRAEFNARRSTELLPRDDKLADGIEDLLNKGYF